MQEILENTSLRRAFWITTISILALLGIVRFVIVGATDFSSPDWKWFVNGVLESLIAAILTTTAIGAFIFYLAPKLDRGSQVWFLPTKEFNDYFASELKESREWYFRGGLGRFLSTEVLPRMNEIALSRQTPVTVRAQILNPRNNQLCQMHAQLRNSVPTVDGRGDWDCEEIKRSLYTTIVTAAIFESNNPLLEISVYLMNYFSTDRVDISTTSGIVTKDDRNVPGLTFSNESILYHSYRGDLAITEKQGDVVRPLSKPFEIGELTGTQVKDILDELGFDDALDDEGYTAVATQTNQQFNPYSH